MDNKQKIIEILEKLYDGQVYWDVRPFADEIDALYHRDCGKCKYSGDFSRCSSSPACMWVSPDYYEEDDK